MTEEISSIMKLYNVTKRAAVIIYVVDTGILQVTDDGVMYKGNKLSGYKDCDGYQAYFLMGSSTPLHKIIAYIKFGVQALKHGIVTRHLDDNQDNNSFDNIGIGSPKDNWHDMPMQKQLAIMGKTNSKLTYEVRQSLALTREANKSAETKRQEAIKSWKTRRQHDQS